MKKICAFLLCVCLSLGLCCPAAAETYYKLSEQTYQETVQFIEDSLYLNQQLQNKIDNLKKQQLTLQQQIEELQQQQQTLKNSYNSNEIVLKEQNKILNQQCESLKKKNKKLETKNDLLYMLIGGIIITNLN